MAKKKRENYGPSPILMWIFVIILVAVLFFLVNSSLFNVSQITVKGNALVSSEEIISLSGINYDTNILHVDEVLAKENIETNYFVVVDNIRRTFPTGVEIIVHERTPVAQIGTINGYYIIDADGVTIGCNPVEAENITSITNLGILQPQGGQKIESDSSEKLENVFMVLDAIDKYELNGEILGIDMKDPQRILLTYKGDIKVQIGSGLTADNRLKNLKAIVETVKGTLNEGQVINMESSNGYYIG